MPMNTNNDNPSNSRLSWKRRYSFCTAKSIVASSILTLLTTTPSSRSSVAHAFRATFHGSPKHAAARVNPRTSSSSYLWLAAAPKEEQPSPPMIVVVDKTYVALPMKDAIIDTEGAMAAFFESRQEWLPLFRSVAGARLPVDTQALWSGLVSNDDDNNIQPIVAPFGESESSASTGSTVATTATSPLEFHETSSPWRRYDAIPQDADDRAVLASFLDAMQASLLAIPVNEVPNPDIVDDGDEHDLQFVEEGRRLLALGRFHVLRNNNNSNGEGSSSSSSLSSVESVDALFSRCWSEILELSQVGTAHTGSLILVPEYELVDLRRFVDMNLLKPLEWLGVHADFEVVSLERASPAIRLIYKLENLRTGTYTEEDGFAARSE